MRDAGAAVRSGGGATTWASWAVWPTSVPRCPPMRGVVREAGAAGGVAGEISALGPNADASTGRFSATLPCSESRVTSNPVIATVCARRAEAASSRRVEPMVLLRTGTAGRASVPSEIACARARVGWLGAGLRV